MSCLIYNCRRLGNPKIVHELHNIVRMEASALVFLCDTKIDGKRVANLTARLGLQDVFRMQ